MITARMKITTNMIWASFLFNIMHISETKYLFFSYWSVPFLWKQEHLWKILPFVLLTTDHKCIGWWTYHEHDKATACGDSPQSDLETSILAP